MRFRKLRIAWSMAWGAAAVLLSGLWVRSYWWRDGIGINLSPTYIIHFESDEGRIKFVAGNSPVATKMPGWQRVPNHIAGQYRKAQAQVDQASGLKTIDHVFYFDVDRPPFRIELRGRHWIPLLLAATISAVPWLSWPRQFSLRTLLIATTLVAVILALAVYSIPG